MKLALIVIALAASGCYATLPPQLAEGTDVRPAGGVDFTLSGGAATFEGRDLSGTWNNELGAGGEARVRVGVGARQEVGASLFLGAGTSVGNGDPPFAAGGKLSYKVAPVRWLAVVAGGGAMDYAVSATAVFSGDLAVIAAPYTSAGGTQLYVGAKGAFGIPVLSNATTANETLVLPIGVQIPTSRRLRLYFEGGPIWGFAQRSQGGGTASTWSVGPYGIVAFTYQLR